MIERLFCCVVCQRDINDYPWRNGRDRHIAPICNSCERGDGDRKPHAGAFMDRRMALRGSALANALSQEAHAMQWRSDYGRS
jgi:hypothetical protein